MTFNPRRSIDDGLLLLAERLDLIITDTLSDVLQGLEWTVILEELDKSRDHEKKQYYRRDVSAQLTMLQYRLGNLGYPFEKSNDRFVSTQAQQLRIMRNRLAHGSEFNVEDAYRTNDFVYRLLEYFGDDEGVERAENLRLAALGEFARIKGLVAPSTDSQVDDVEVGNSDVDPEEDVSPDPSTLVRKGDTQTPNIGVDRAMFEPWKVIRVGDPSDIANLRTKAAKEQVHALAEEIVEFEGPIELGRLVKFISASFNIGRLTNDFRRSLERQVWNSDVLVDADNFVWPKSVDPKTWREFRPQGKEARLGFWEISPVEISNAAQFIRKDGTDLSESEVEKLTLQTFGRKRRSKSITNHLKRALDLSRRPGAGSH